MTHEARELELFIENDAQLYRSQLQPIQKNLITKMARGVYRHELAVKLFMYLMDNGAKKYVREFASAGEWNRIFTVADRKAVAESFARHFETEAKLGNYDNYLPKKYQGQRVSNPSGLPVGKFVKATKVRVNKNGTIDVMVASRDRQTLTKRKR